MKNILNSVRERFERQDSRGKIREARFEKQDSRVKIQEARFERQDSRFNTESRISSLISPISNLQSPISNLISHNSYLITPIPFLIFFLCFTPAFSQELTVRQAIEKAWQQNRTLKIMGMEVESQRKLTFTAKELPKTSVELQYGRIQVYNQLDYMLGVAQSFNHPKYYKSLADLLNKQVSVVEQNQFIRKNELAFQVKQIYTRLSHLKALQLIVSQQDSVYQVAKKIATIRREAGESSRVEVVTAEAELAANAQRFNMIEYERKQLIAQLNFLIHNSSNALFLPKVEPLTWVYLPQQNSIVNNPLLLLYNYQKEVAQSQIVVEKNRLLPEFKAGVFNQSMEKHYTPMIALGGVSIPLYTKPQKARIEALKINENIIVENQNFFQAQLTHELENQALNQQKFQFMNKYYEEVAMPQDDILLNLTYKRYLNSEAIYYEYIQMIRKVYDIKERYLQNLHDLKQTINEIEFLTAKEL